MIVGKKLALSLVALVIFGVGFALPASASPDDWPMFRFNPEHTGATPEAVTPPLVPIWTYDTGGSVESSPAVSGGILYVASGNGKVYALNATTGTHIWNYTITTRKRAASSPAVIDGVVYVGSWDDPQSRVFALNATTGAQIWNSTAGNRVYSSPAVSGGVVYVGSCDSKIYALNATTGTHIWNYTTGDEVRSSPAVSGGVVYVGSDDGYVYALNATTGAYIWSSGAGFSVRSSPAVSGGVVYIGSVSYGMVYAFNAITGAYIWSYKTGLATYSSPAVSEGVVYIGASSGFYALNATTGAQIWNYTGIGLVLSSPAVSGDVVYFGSYDDNIYVLNATTGAYIWSYETGFDVYSSPAVSGGFVYVGSYDYKVYAFRRGALLAVNTNPAGLEPAPIVAPLDLWYDVGTEVTCTAQEVTEYEFSHWTIDDVSQGAGVNPITVTMDAYHTATANYAVVAVPDFNIVVQQTSETVTQGESTTVAVTVTSIDGYSEIVTLSTSGQPAGVSVNFDPETGTPSFNSDMIIGVGDNVEPNTYTITITGTGADEKVHTTTFELTVTEKTQSLLELLELLAPWIILLIIVIIIIIILIIWKRK